MRFALVFTILSAIAVSATATANPNAATQDGAVAARDSRVFHNRAYHRNGVRSPAPAADDDLECVEWEDVPASASVPAAAATSAADDLECVEWEDVPAATSAPAAAATSAGTTAGACTPVEKWGTCGGIDYTGCTTCVAGTTCTYSNDWYSQCL